MKNVKTNQNDESYQVTYGTGVSWVASARTLLGTKREAIMHLNVDGGEISIQMLGKLDSDGDPSEVAFYDGLRWTRR